MPDFKPQRDRLTIQERATGRDVVARLVDLTPSMARRLITRTWWAPIAITKSTREADRPWPWEGQGKFDHAEVEDNLVAGTLVTATPERGVEIQGAPTFDLGFTSFREQLPDSYRVEAIPASFLIGPDGVRAANLRGGEPGPLTGVRGRAPGRPVGLDRGSPGRGKLSPEPAAIGDPTIDPAVARRVDFRAGGAYFGDSWPFFPESMLTPASNHDGA